MKGLTTNTERIFESVSRLECIKPYILAGGTALFFQSDLLAMLTNSNRFVGDIHFEQLEPAYNVSPGEIEAFIRSLL